MTSSAKGAPAAHSGGDAGGHGSVAEGDAAGAAVAGAAGLSLCLKGAVNARDLGGYRTADGRSVRAGVAFRSDALVRLTDDDLQVLVSLGVRQVVDLRGPDEVRQDGADRLPGLPGTAVDPAAHRAAPTTFEPDVPGAVRLHHLPVHAPEHDVYTALRGVRTRDAARHRALLGDGRAERIMADMYRWFVLDPVARNRFARVVRLLAESDGPPLLFHCTAGKDRTGWAAAIVLTAVGVDRDTVFEDYLLTNDRTAALVERIVDTLGARGTMEEPALLLPIIRADERYLAAAFDAVAERWPSFGAFLAEGLGLEAVVLDGLRANLVGH